MENSRKCQEMVTFRVRFRDILVRFRDILSGFRAWYVGGSDPGVSGIKSRARVEILIPA